MIKHNISPWQLGATLYMPALRADLVEVVSENKIPGLRSLVICLEDSVHENQVGDAITNLNDALIELAYRKQQGNSQDWPVVFVRPRNAEMAKQLVEDYELSAVDGFVIPKFTHACIDRWWGIVASTNLLVMPTLETDNAFSEQDMRLMASALKAHPLAERVLALRIGANDLMSVLSLRRSRCLTIYDGPLGYTIKMLVVVFGAQGFHLTAPVCEVFENEFLLEAELELDLAHGLVGKTAIHPKQIDIINQEFCVSDHDVQDAHSILGSTNGVFKSNGAMCEPATHRRWAESIKQRATIFGAKPNVSTNLSELRKTV
jgi:citrate lyase beta subunit